MAINRNSLAYVIISLVCHVTGHPRFSARSNTTGCAEKGTTLYCDGHVPRRVQPGIVQVIVWNNTVGLSNATFSHVSWRNVQLLDIEEEEQVTNEFVANMFGNMENLVTLGLHIPAPYDQTSGHINTSAFAGLKKLQQLDMSGCARFSFDKLFDLVKNSSNFPMLRRLILKNFNYVGYGTLLDLNATFLELLGKRRIKKLVVDKSRIYRFYVDPFMPLCDSIETLSGRHVDLRFLKSTKRPGTCQALTTLDLSGYNGNVPHSTIYVEASIDQRPNVVVNFTGNDNTPILLKFIANVERLYIEDGTLNIPNIPIHYKIIYEKTEALAMKHLSFRRSVMPIIDIEIETMVSLNLRTLDLSNCGIRFIGTKTFASPLFRKLSNLYLANNSLHLMNQNKEFMELFLHLGNLRRLDLSNNRLVCFPTNMLKGNLNIETLDLSQNVLKQFYQFVSLPNLRHVDLKANQIDYLDINSRKWFDNIYANSNGSQFLLDLRNNSFHCLCAELEFFSWMFTKTFVIYTKPTYCNWNGARIEISVNKLKELQFECTKISYVIRNVGISIGSVVASIGLITTLFTGVKRILKTYRSREKRRKAICEIQNHSFQYNFLAFLSYSPMDEDIVLKQIHPHLLESLCKITMVNKEFICIGDREFRPGYSMYNEAHRCLHDSAVALVVISQDYCQNAHCKNELEQIVYEGKPIVFLILAPDDGLNEIPLIKQLISNSFSASVVGDNGNVLFKPDLKDIACAILGNVE